MQECLLGLSGLCKLAYVSVCLCMCMHYASHILCRSGFISLYIIDSYGVAATVTKSSIVSHISLHSPVVCNTHLFSFALSFTSSQPSNPSNPLTVVVCTKPRVCTLDACILTLIDLEEGLGEFAGEQGFW